MANKSFWTSNFWPFPVGKKDSVPPPGDKPGNGSPSPPNQPKTNDDEPESETPGSLPPDD